ncbi:conserved hypothetical protein [Ricinus communis]|uniref:Uncharacterized protein n=1 Tax=Ricinus communis TaxID=3988 RepID=B9SBY3_RICCO|nr:conserved hypothetical protein [Ricinus communis]
MAIGLQGGAISTKEDKAPHYPAKQPTNSLTSKFCSFLKRQCHHSLVYIRFYNSRSSTRKRKDEDDDEEEEEEEEEEPHLKQFRAN